MFNGRIVRRAWGWYWTILDRKHFKIKLLRFKAGAQCSLQYHSYRNELWLFLSGYGLFSKGANVYSEYANGKLVEKNEWRNVEMLCPHQYNAMKVTYVLEIQYGDKCDEEDIVRL